MIKQLAMALLLSLLTLRCATVVHGRSQQVPVASTPTGASVSLTCDGATHEAGTTPASVTVPRKAEVCAITVTHTGFASRTILLTRVRSGAAWWNLGPGVIVGAFAGAATATGSLLDESSSNSGNGNSAFAAGLVAGTGIGFLIDSWTGALYQHVPAKIDTTLEPAH